MISEFQKWVAQIFHELKEADGYALGGGGAAIAHEVVHRATQDLDMFRRLGGDTALPSPVGEALVRRMAVEGCSCRVLVDGIGLFRVVIRRGEDVVLVDIGEEDRTEAPVATFMGPTVAMRDVGVGKLVALFDRAEARDFTDVFEFSAYYDRGELLALAQKRDGGLHAGDLAERCRRMTDHYLADDLPEGYRERHVEIRAFYQDWREELLDAGAGR